jgi:hypothetical protein
MPGQPQLTLLLEVVRLDPLAGRLGPLGGPLRPFFGWIGLASAITGCLDAVEARDGDGGSGEDV